MNTPAPLHTRFTQRYGVKHPFAAAGLGFAGMTPALALAVDAAGGIGAIGVATMPGDELRRCIRVLQACAKGPFNINFIGCFDNEERLRICLDEGVPIVSWHWGGPTPAQQRDMQTAGVSWWQQVGSVQAARKAVDGGAQAIVAQGWEAGGHNLQGVDGAPGLPTFVFLPQVVDAVGAHTLVLASGGVADGRGVAAALALGADAVWVGTRLVATQESDAHPEHKRRIVASSGDDTVLTSIFSPEWPVFNPMRVRRNAVVQRLQGRMEEARAHRQTGAEVGHTVLFGQPLRLGPLEAIPPTAQTQADWEAVPWLMGQSAGLIHDLPSATDVVQRMMTEAASICQRMAGATA